MPSYLDVAQVTVDKGLARGNHVRFGPEAESVLEMELALQRLVSASLKSLLSCLA